MKTGVRSSVGRFIRRSATGRRALRVWFHPANRIRRLRGYTTWIGYEIARGLGIEPVALPLGVSSRILVDRRFYSSDLVAYGSPPDWNEAQAWKRLVKGGDRFVDVGANVGVYTLLMAELGLRVIAVEPDDEARQRLLLNVALNGFQVDVVPAALAETSGVRLMTTGRGTMNRLIAEQADDAFTRSIRCLTLDDLVGDEEVAGVKLDVEGFERLVLQGASNSLRNHRIHALQIEWNHMSQVSLGEDRIAVANLLRDHGYQLFRPDAGRFLHSADPSQLGADVFALPRTYPRSHGR